MPLSESALIERYFRVCGAQRPDVLAGIGDDAALLAVAPDAELVAATDTLVAGVHFPNGSPPASIGHRALAVNLSDLAAMGARPAWALLALTLPEADEGWLAEFAAGLGALARAHDAPTQRMEPPAPATGATPRLVNAGRFARRKRLG